MIITCGLPKTGNTSIGKALQILGYKVRQHDEDFRLSLHKGFPLANPVDAYVNSCEWLIPQADELYSTSDEPVIWIYTYRDVDRWLDSTAHHLGNTKTVEIHRQIYGTEKFHGNFFRAVYERHQQQTLEYFRANNRLVTTMNVEAGDGWEHLCNLLNKPIPSVEFPHENQTRKDTMGSSTRSRRNNTH